MTAVIRELSPISPDDERRPNRTFAGDPLTPPYNLYNPPAKGIDAVIFADEVAKISDEPTKLDRALLLEQLMQEGKRIIIPKGETAELIPVAVSKEE